MSPAYTEMKFYYYHYFIIRAVYTRENKPRLTLAAAYIRRKDPV